MRQSGVIAAACLYALDHHVERLAEDHENARVLAEGLAGLPGVRLDPRTVETNIVIIDLEGIGAPELIGRMLDEHGVRLSLLTPSTVRAVTYLGITRADVETALEAARAVLGDR
jgi:threonine aldolase